MLPDQLGIAWTTRDAHTYSCGRRPVLTQQQRRAHALRLTVWVLAVLLCLVFWAYFGPLVVHAVCAAWTLLRKAGA